MQHATLSIASDHPAYAGHFPGRPVLPGVVLLDHAMLAIEDACQLQLSGLLLAKFHSPVSPGQALRLEFRQDAAAVAFTLFHEQRKVADGKFAIAVEQAG
ncbi:FabA domain protein [Pseudogulbenkiania sp. NH8B]|uniref:FabA domain containing protein n=1 Tax=Pseudogulbenkiania sp. (strain NH8B) TaxID=748280 RepID=UPI0002279E37|nr:FabA domain containing protein [Pseudogulbenkiania sp. NH8B]BAK76078.1 FabA domain protein [Pseudogulbenkiania sp. NH8B]